MPARTRSASVVENTATDTRDTLADKFACLRDEALRAWRQAAATLAADGPSPRPEEVLRLGGMLNITDPARALEGDAEAVRQMARIQGRITRTLAANAEMVKPWGGDRDRLLEDIANTEQRLKDMRRALLIGFDGASDWYGPRERLKKSNPRMFPQEARR